jgi:hypothetical protein
MRYLMWLLGVGCVRQESSPPYKAGLWGGAESAEGVWNGGSYSVFRPIAHGQHDLGQLSRTPGSP